MTEAATGVRQRPGAAGTEGVPAAPITFQAMADKLTLGLLTSVVGAIIVFVSAFLTWSTVDARGAAGKPLSGAVTDSMGISGGRLGTVTVICSIVALAVVGVMLLPITKPWAWQVLLGLGSLIVLLALIEVVTLPRALSPGAYSCPSGVTCTFHRTIGPGVWFTLVAGAIVIAGAYLHHLRPVPFVRPEASPQPVKPAAEEAAPA